MKPLFLFLFLSFTVFAGAPAHAQMKDPAYFLGDGIMTRDEMEEEAEYIRQECTYQPNVNLYYNCECLAGAFLIEREKYGPDMPQSNIYSTILVNPKLNCANKEKVAGSAYGMCTNIQRNYFEMEKNSETKCICVGNRFAIAFAKRPMLSSSYVEMLLSDSMIYCADPKNRGPKAPPAKDNNLDFRTLN